ncbi:RDD family protein [soil metagenome]
MIPRVPARQTPSVVRAGLARRLSAMAYDLLIVAALLMLATAALMPVTRGAIEPDHLWYRAYLLTIAAAYFCGFWIGGQTMGMRAWRMRVERTDGRPLRVRDAMLRMLAAVLSWAAFGLGFVSAFADNERRTWHDRLSKTRLVVVPRAAKRTRASGSEAPH